LYPLRYRIPRGTHSAGALNTLVCGGEADVEDDCEELKGFYIFAEIKGDAGLFKDVGRYKPVTDR